MFFFFNDTATTEIYTLPLHAALPISMGPIPADNWLPLAPDGSSFGPEPAALADRFALLDRKSTRLNSSHANISYAVFCLKKKNGRRKAFPRACRGSSASTGHTRAPSL